MIRKMLRRHEGLRLKPYQCTAGKTTIGIGRNIQDRGITEREALMLLENDITEVREGLIRSLPWYSSLDEVRRAVLEDMSFNMGVQGLLKFKRFLTAVETGEWTDAVAEMWDSRWAFQVGDGPGGIEDRVDRLTKMMKSGQWPTDL